MIQVEPGDSVDLGVRASMIEPKNRLFCRLDGLTPEIREGRRVTTLKNLGLLEAETVPVFDEATQTAARFLEAPICLLGLMVEDELWIKSAVGLSRLGLMNQLATLRKIPRRESFSTYVVDSEQNLTIEDAIADPVFAHSTLVQHYGIRAFLGTPLIPSTGQCIGALAVMDLAPRQFTNRDLEFLALTARWCLREFERDRLLKTQAHPKVESLTQLPILKESQQAGKLSPSTESQHAPENGATSTHTNQIKVRLLRQLTEKLRTPLTSVIGMASVLRGEVYGSLTGKQKEYLEIIHTSGQQMLSLVEEIVSLGVLEENMAELQLSDVDIEILCQQVLGSLLQLAKQQQQEFRLSVEPGNRSWLLDKKKVRQALYYLVISLIEASQPGGEVRIHVSHRSNTLNFSAWISHPWVGDGLPQVELHSSSVANALPLNLEMSPEEIGSEQGKMSNILLKSQNLTSSDLTVVLNEAEKQDRKLAGDHSRRLLGLLLSCHLVKIHGGKILLQGSLGSGYRYVLKLPRISTAEG